MTLIEKSVQPSIQHAYQRMEVIQQQLIAQINDVFREAENDLQKKKEIKAKMERAAILNAVLGVFGILGSALSFLGTAGTVAGGIVNTGTSIAQSFAVQSNPSQVSFAIPPTVVSSLNDANKLYFEKEIQRIERVAKAVEDANTQLGNGQLNSQVQLAGNVTKLATAAKSDLQTGNVPKFLKSRQSLDEASNKLKMSTFDQAAQINKANRNEQQVTNVIKKLVTAMSTVDGIANVITSAKHASSSIDDITKAIVETERLITVFETKKMEFYTEFVPTLDSMYIGLVTETHTLAGNSHAALQIKRWQMKSVLQNMRQYVNSFASGLPVEESFELSFSALDEAITVLIRLYEHMEVLQDKKELADYIANVNAAGAIKIGNRELDSTIQDMSHIVKANLFLDEYNTARQAFKQWVFPFAEQYLYAQHNKYTTNAILDEVLNIYTNEIEHLKEALKAYKAAIVKTDEYLQFETFSSDAVTTEPFFTWNNAKWKDSIAKLLAGKSIRLKADPSMHHQNKTEFFRNKSAIKFQHIEVKLKAVGNCTQAELDNNLRYFGMAIRHFGHSIYRVAGTDYIIDDKAQTYKYSFEKNANGHVSRNGVQYKVAAANADFMMSPYTWWGIKITDPKTGDGVGFQRLKKFAECVDIELEGEGVYLDELEVKNEFLQNLKLNEHYEVYDNDQNLMKVSGTFYGKTCKE